ERDEDGCCGLSRRQSRPREGPEITSAGSRRRQSVQQHTDSSTQVVSHFVWKLSSALPVSLVPAVPSLDHLISPEQQRLRDRQPERLRRLEIDDQLKLRSLTDREVAGVCAS